MLFLLILPILVAGFFACHIHPVYLCHLHRYEGQYLYLRSAGLGLLCFFIATILAMLGHYCIPDEIQFFGKTVSFKLSNFFISMATLFGASAGPEASKMAWFLILSILMFVAAFMVKMFSHIQLRLRFGRWKDTKPLVTGELLDDSPLDSLLFQSSLSKATMVMLTMDDRKVYVGKIISLGEPTATSGIDQDISIMPVMSGYRDKDNLRVNFTTHYADAELSVYTSLRQDAIVSATEFDLDGYKRLRSMAGTVIPAPTMDAYPQKPDNDN